MGKGSVQRDSNVSYVAFGPDEFEPERPPAPMPSIPRDSSGRFSAALDGPESTNRPANAALLGSGPGQTNGGRGGGGDGNGDGLSWEVRYSSNSGHA